jgi:hypothetical protein
MRTLALFIPAVVALAGCATSPPPPAYGNFVTSPDAVHSKKIAADAVKQLEALYPPARTRFNLQQITSDPFGTALVTNLRARGYALQELPTAASARPKEVRKDATTRAASSPDNMTLSYVLDRPVDLDLYRVTLLIGDKALSRVYQSKDGTVAPAGSWVRKE